MSKKKDVKKRKYTEPPGHFGVTRRTALKMTAAAGAVTMLTSRKSWAFALPPIPPEPTDCTPNPGKSPETIPFVQALPIPPIAIPTILNPQPTVSANLAAGEAPRADHQNFNQFFPFVQYDISIQPTLHQFDPAIPPTYCWGYNGIYPGPTFLGVYGLPSLVRFRNNLPVNHNGFGTNTHTTHLHNGHTASESDGFASDFWSPGFFKDHHYPNVYAGFNAHPPIGDPLEAQYTYWYHDHRHSFTATNNYRGLNGMYLLFDQHDSGLGIPTGDRDQDDNVGLPGPYGIFDIPLNLTDKLFCANGQMFATAPDAVPAGDKFIVNGVIQPFFQVKSRKYRFRILNSGPARIWLLNIIDNNGNVVPFQVVATDGNLLPSPVTMPDPQETAVSGATLGGGPGLQIHVSQRYDIVVDFTNATAGTSWFLTNNAAQFVNNSAEPQPAPGLNIGNVIMRFDITGPPQLPDLSVVPNVLTTLPDISGNPAVATRTLNFNFALVGPEGDPENPNAARVFNINGLTFDGDRADATMKQGSAETWLIRNRFPGSGWVHPVHIHLEEGRVLDRRTKVNGVITNHFVPPLQRGRRDVYPVGGGDEILVYLQFRDWFGKYMIHCHNLGHEDGLMLVRWDVGTATSPSTSATYSDGNANTGNVNGTVVPESGGQPNIVPALTTLADSFDLGKADKPAVKGSKKGVSA
ncbi:MAG TPA: multicopper oxidase domain-containing protein [Candidatus Angelobacter sp.]|jgi:FtsP/CotA-like multicopper oxidase with cupredoxin domain